MNVEEFRESAHRAFLLAFLESPTGKEVMAQLERRARPMASAVQKGTHDDVAFQMSLTLADSVARFGTIHFIESLTKLPETRAIPLENLEDELEPEITAPGVPPILKKKPKTRK